MKISVVIPVYNVERYLNACLDSVFSQTFQDFEVICINDGSTDSSLHVLEAYAKNQSNLKIYTIENKGQANARNLGVKMANAEFICFIDSDDTIEPTMLERLVNVQEADQCDMVICGIDRVFSEGCSKAERSFTYDANLEDRHSFDIHTYPKIITLVNNSPFSKLIRKSVIIEHSISFPVGYIYEDMVFTHMLLATGLSISMIHEPLYHYVVRAGSTMTSKKSKVTDMFDAYKMVIDYYKKLGIDNRFKAELDYLGLYHVGIGTSFRMYRSHQYSLFKSIHICRVYLKKLNCSKKNKYLNSKSFIERLFIKLFM